MPERIVTCALCGAHCLASKATEYEYEGPAEPVYVDGVNTTAGQTQVHTRLACPRCWAGIAEVSAG